MADDDYYVIKDGLNVQHFESCKYFDIEEIEGLELLPGGFIFGVNKKVIAPYLNDEDVKAERRRNSKEFPKISIREEADFWKLIAIMILK